MQALQAIKVEFNIGPHREDHRERFKAPHCSLYIPQRAIRLEVAQFGECITISGNNDTMQAVIACQSERPELW